MFLRRSMSDVSNLSTTSSQKSKMSRPAAHQNAPDQSTRILSAFVEEVTAGGPGSGDKSTLDLLCAQLQVPSELDAWFLHGGAAELGVPTQATSKGKKPMYEAVCARALWESHWREEWCCIYNTHVAFFPPLSRKPAWVLHYADVLSVRMLPSEGTTVPGECVCV